MKSLFALLALLLIVQITAGQSKGNEFNFLQKAIDYRKNGEYEKALKIHQKLYTAKQSNKLNTYNLACLFGTQDNKDSCLKYLDLSISPYIGLRALSDPDLYPMHKYPEWDSVEAKILKVSAGQVRRISNLDYAKKLYRLSAADQAFYSEIRIAEKKHGHDSKEAKNIWKKKNALNKKNQAELENLIKENGWPKRSELGGQAAMSAFLIIQHADLEKMKHYIPTLKKYCFEGEGSCQSYALMFDRIRVSQNQPQRYGTQVRYDRKKKEYELFPLENEGLIDEYRERMGLGSIEKYVEKWDIKLKLKKVSRKFAYADSLVSASLGKESKIPYFHGVTFNGPNASLGKPVNKGFLVPVPPTNILGPEEESCLTMPKGTEVVVAFTENQIVNYPDQPDIFVKEHGGAADRAMVYVSHDGKEFEQLGITYDGRASYLDLDSINYQKSVKYIKLVALDNNGSAPGYDLVYIKGLPGSSVDAKMSETDIKKYLSKARKEVTFIQRLGGIKLPVKSVDIKPLKIEIIKNRNRFILEDVLFDTRSSQIQNNSIPYLILLAGELRNMNYKKIQLIGHTDNRGSNASNMTLSKNRAIAIRDYLISQGVSSVNIECIGLGPTQPRRSNDTAHGRAKNRRTEINIIK